jgi:Lon protease-like protein
LNSIIHQQLNLPAQAPVMVLPNAQLFPNTLLPLYIFEECYRKMLAACLEQNRMFCVALMKPGPEDAEPADYFTVAGLGLIRACVEREDGTSHLILQGLARVRLINLVQVTPFRIAELRELRSDMSNRIEAEALGAKVLELCEKRKRLGKPLPPAVEKHLPQISTPEMLSDVITHSLLSDPFQRQELLEQLNVSERLRLLIQHLQKEL